MVASAKTDKSKPPVFHQLELARGWRIIREHVKLRIDLDRRTIAGTAKFEFCALSNQFVNIALNLRRCRVTSCLINDKPASFRIVSPLDDDKLLAAVSSDTARHRVANIEHSVRLREDASAIQGELVVDLPAAISADIIDELTEAFQKASPDADLIQNPPEFTAVPALPLEHLPVLTLRIDYEAYEPSAGAVYFGNQDASNPVIDPVYMLTDSRFGMARFWMPCIDSMQWCDRYLFDFDIAVKSSLLVIASGELTETVIYTAGNDSEFPTDDPIKVFKYRLLAPAHASEVVIAVGDFVPLPDPALSKTVTYFCLPGLARELVHTCPPLFAKALAFCRDYFGADPPTSSFKHVFVGSLGRNAGTTTTGAGGVVVYSGDILHDSRSIDEAFIAREAVMSGLVMSYFGRFLRPRQAEDDWLICGLAAHVTTLGLGAILGRNWYRFRIMDLMDMLRQEKSVDLSDVKINRVTDETLDSVKRRSHVIVYMIEKRIGCDVLKRALRDIVAEGRSIIASLVRVFDTFQEKALEMLDDNRVRLPMTIERRRDRTLIDLTGKDPEQSGSSSVVSSGFDEALQGVSVGPFLKRLRAICGTDLRSLVRLWAASTGVPRLRIGYQYNPRRHCLEFAVKQEGIVKGETYDGREGLVFTGSLHVRVMEIEGASEHTVEIRDPFVVIDVPCHSHRAKHKSASQAEKEFNENPARASPVLWVRIDPDAEWCIDVVFKQSEDSWTALVKGERDAMGQVEACRGLRGFKSEASAKALLVIVEDERLYWRVRAEAARVLATYKGGLGMLLKYFREFYFDSSSGKLGLVRPNHFSNFANYFVKRAMIGAIVNAREDSPKVGNFQPTSVPIEATEFLSFMLSTNDNTRNPYDDDHYVADLIKACGKVGVICLEDPKHAKAGEDNCSTTDSISKQLERYKAIEELVPRRTGLVSCAVMNALCDIEVAKLALQNRTENGKVTHSILQARFSTRPVILRSIESLARRECAHDTRLAALSCLARAYSGDLEVALWLLGRCDRNSSYEELVDLHRIRREHDESSKWGFIEAPSFRYRVLDILTNAAMSDSWGVESSPLLLAVRRHTKRAMQLCTRILRLSVGEADPRVRAAALRFAKVAWGIAVPVCLLGRSEYAHARRTGHSLPVAKAVEVVPLQTNGSTSIVQGPQLQGSLLKAPKSGKASKSNKSAKSGKRKLSLPKSAIIAEPLSGQDHSRRGTIDVDAWGTRPKLASTVVTEPEIKKPSSGVSASQPVPVIDLDKKPISIGIPKSIPAVPKSAIPKSVPNVSRVKKSPDVPKSTVKASSSKGIPKSIPNRVPFSIPRNTPGIPRSVLSIPKSVVGIPHSVPRNSVVIPKAVAAGLPKKVPFDWDPLDQEDFEFFKKVVQQRREGKLRQKAREAETEKLARDANKGSEHPPNGAEADMKRKKKKKKKKRRLEGEEGRKKRKKKRKHHDDEGERYTEPNFDPDFTSSTPSALPNGGSASGSSPKFGKMKVKLAPVSSVDRDS